MKIEVGKITRQVLLLSVTLALLVAPKTKAQADQWNDPFEASASASSIQITSDSMTLSSVLKLVGRENPSLQANGKRILAAEKLVSQAGLYPNPDLQVDIEEVAGDAAGFSESEINITISQEFELWGKRGARKRLATIESKSVRLMAKFESFDLYASVVEWYSRVQHAQNKVTLSEEETEIAKSIVETVKLRVDKGASLPSEYILGQLQFERAQLNLDQAVSELIVAKMRLASYWNDSASDYSVKQSSVSLDALARINNLELRIESARGASFLEGEEQIVSAQLALEESNGKPNVTLTGGLKRFEVDNANTFILGVSLPLPFFNRNQGSTASLRESVKALKLDRQQAITDSRTVLNYTKRILSQLTARYQSLSTSLLPKAENTYSSLRRAYDSGRIQYSILLESQRTLVDIRFELNDLMLTINRQLIKLERIYGVQLH